MQIRGSGVVEHWSDGVRGKDAGFTILELLVAIALGMVILAGLFRTFKVQQDSYVIQDQVSAMQQNLRVAMYMITRDLQMAGYYTNYDRSQRPLDLNGNGAIDAGETGRPLVFATDGGSGPDVITVVKADYDPIDPKCKDGTSSVCRRLGSINGSASDGTISLGSWDLGGYNFGVLVKQDLTSADLFQVAGGAVNPVGTLMENYGSEDLVYRTDIISYRINTVAGRPYLQRRNLANNNGYQDVAENIENLQFRYLIDDGSPNGTWVNSPTGNQTRGIRAVEVFLIGRTAYPQRGYIDSSTYTFGSGTATYSYTPLSDDRKYRRKVLTSLVKTRNIGL
jgi:type IV pilus assembly protein PilW